MAHKITNANIKEWARDYQGELFDAILCDPPYELGFMGKSWDSSGIAFDKDMWADILKLLKPGGHLLAFSGSRTYHRMACAIEDAGFEIRDMIEWVYGSGFPKSLNIGKAVDKIQGNEREVVLDESRAKRLKNQTGNYESPNGMKSVNRNPNLSKGNSPYEGYRTALKPAHEPCVLARKPLEKGHNVAQNALKHGTGGLNIDGSRITTNEDQRRPSKGGENGLSGTSTFKIRERKVDDQPQHSGRFPANLIHDGSDEVVGLFPDTKSGGGVKANKGTAGLFGISSNVQTDFKPDSGSAARFFFSAKPDLYCSLCYGIMEVCENNANNAQPSSALGTQAKDTAQEPVAEQQPPKLEDKNLKQTSPAHNVVNTLASTNQTTVNTAQPNATQNLKELLDLAAKYAESQCLQCQTSIAQKLVVMATESMELQACQDFTQDYKNSIQTENLVSTVAYLANIDITQTTINLMKLCGFAHLATDENTKQASQRSDNATSRLKYTAKASKSERNAGLDIDEFPLKHYLIANKMGGECDTMLTGSGNPRDSRKQNHHPTVKPLSLTKYLANLIKPPTGGRLLVPFSGSGSEMIGALQAGWEYVEGVELTEEYIPIAEARIKYWTNLKEEESNQLELI